MRRSLHHIIWAYVIISCGSCGVTRYLPPGQQLYDGASIDIQKAPEVKTKDGVLHNKLKPLARPKRNKKLFGQFYKVWWWYKIGPSKQEKGFKVWLRNTLGDAP